MALSYEHVFVRATNAAAPPLLLLHGTGGDEHDLLPLAKSISPGSAVLSPRGDVNERGALRFFRRFGEGIFDVEDVRKRTNALADFVIAAEKHYAIPSGRMIALGLSNGANIAGTLLQLRPEVLAGAILFRAMPVIEQSPEPLSLRDKRVLICNGTVDPIISAQQSNTLAELLRSGGAEVTVKMHIASHALVSADVADAKEWIDSIRSVRAVAD
jgi:phospholipase/carboxylesterase